MRSALTVKTRGGSGWRVRGGSQFFLNNPHTTSVTLGNTVRACLKEGGGEEEEESERRERDGGERKRRRGRKRSFLCMAFLQYPQDGSLSPT